MAGYSAGRASARDSPSSTGSPDRSSTRAQAPAEAGKPLSSPAELTKLATAIKPSAAANRWQQIPWLTDVNEARKLATKEKRPLFLWTVFGEPLDEC